MHDLKELLDRGMPKVEKVVCDQLLLHQFLTSLPNTISRQIRATGDVKTLDVAVKCSRLLMVLGDSGHTAAVVTDGFTRDAVEECMVPEFKEPPHIDYPECASPGLTKLVHEYKELF